MQFAGDMGHVDLRAIRVDLGKAGDFDGAGQLANKRLELLLNTRNFDPQGVHSKLRQSRLAGKSACRLSRAVSIWAADLREQNFRLQLDAQHRDAVLELRSATLQSAGSLVLRGTLALDDLKKFQLAGTMQKINPADFGDYPPRRDQCLFLRCRASG